MRYAIVSDLHANLPAWKNVLTDTADLKADKIICLGDVTGYGPNPVEVLESVYSVVDVTLLGNHDAAVCGLLSTETFSPEATAAVKRHRERLSSAALKWLRQLPPTHAEPGFRCAHSDFSDPSAFRYIIEPEDALPSWQATSEQILFVGHSHLPGIYVIGSSGIPHFLAPCDFELEDGKRYIVNPGSVGYPRVGDCRSSYCLYDTDTKTVLFRQLPFDYAGYRQAMHGTGLDDAPWLREKEQQQQRPALRETPSFAKTQALPPLTPARTPTVLIPPPQTPERRPVLKPSRPAWLAVGATLAIGLIAAAVIFIRPAARAESLSVTVPDFDLPTLIAYPIMPQDKNLLPGLPDTFTKGGRIEGWRYAFENKARQSFSNGLRDGAATLCINNKGPGRAQLESPLINLAGTNLRAVRLRGRIRRLDNFSGTVFYQLVTYTTGPDGIPRQQHTKQFELHGSKRKLSPPGAERDVSIPLALQITHVRFRIDASFEGMLEIEQPYLLGERKDGGK